MKYFKFVIFKFRKVNTISQYTISLSRTANQIKNIVADSLVNDETSNILHINEI